MSSIFNGSYSDSMQRVDTNSVKRLGTPASDSSTVGHTENGEKFSNVLSNIESKDTSSRASLGYQPLQAKSEKITNQDELTNLSYSETQSLIENSAQPLSLNKKGIESYKISNSELTFDPTVKTEVETSRLAPDNKTAINQLPPANPGRPPEAPKVLSAKFTGIESPKPATLPAAPTVLSAKVSGIEAPKPALLKPVPDVAMNEQLLEELISAAGREHGIDPNLSVAVARAESSLKVNAVSSDGHHSKGIFQLLDNTGKEMMDRLDVSGKYEPFDAKLNAHLGVGYLRRLHDLFSKETQLGSNLKTVAVKSGADLEKISIAAFNAGEGRVARAQAAAISDGKNPSSYQAIEAYLPLSTRSYVERVSNLKSLADARDEDTAIA